MRVFIIKFKNQVDFTDFDLNLLCRLAKSAQIGSRSPLITPVQEIIDNLNISLQIEHQSGYSNNTDSSCYHLPKLANHFTLTLSFLFTKLVSALNALCHLVILNLFLAPKNSYSNCNGLLYGFWFLYDIVMGREWAQSGHFPLVTLCDFEVRNVGNLNRYTVQCALLANLINEKLFLMIW